MTLSSENDLTPFKRGFFASGKAISFIGSGSLGGKAQNLANINNTLSSDIDALDFAGIEIAIPTFTVIRTDIFDAFMQRNDLYDLAFSEIPDDHIAHAFQKADLPFEILGDLRALTTEVLTPLAVRSSSMLEDAMHEPFAGIYGTKMTPNNQHSADMRFRKLIEAVKFVYSSTYFNAAKNYIRATRHNIKDEKMAIIIQNIVGQRYGELYYPQLSGVARSYNFYPQGRTRPEDGVVNLALGLGKTIVDGGLSWTYSPAYPNISPPYASVNELLKQTQTEFWSVNMGKAPDYDPIKETEYMRKENLTVADKDDSLRHIASTIDNYSGRLAIGTGSDGPRILNFAPILKLAEIPLNNLIKRLLAVCKEALQAAVEIEFAMTFDSNKKEGFQHHFGLLQVRPMVVSSEQVKIEQQELNSADCLAASLSALGNGYLESVKDIVYVIPDNFESKFTPKIALEIEALNKKLVSQKRPYLLIGFGRWGSSDPWLGIPVNWGDVSGSRAIVEATLEKMNVELSQGSHFFHNLTSFGVFYFPVPFSGLYKIDWSWLAQQKAEEQGPYVRHVKLRSALHIKVDGHSGKGIIYKTKSEK